MLKIVGPLIEAGIWLIAWTLPSDERKSVHQNFRGDSEC